MPWHVRACVCVFLNLLLLLSGCWGWPRSAPEGAQSQPGASQSREESPTEASPGSSQVPGDRSAPAEPEPAAEPYDFSQPAPEREAVDNSYFEDAAFVGDSRTEGFFLYSGVGHGEKLTSIGLSIFRLAEEKALTIDGEAYTLLEALALKKYGKVYLSLGVNELGYHNDQGFYQDYCQAIDTIRAAEPDAVIYIQGIIPVNEELAREKTGKDYFTNEHVRIYNDLMRRAAEEKRVVYLDLYSAFADEHGNLPEQASQDGIHLKGEYLKRWLTYLQTHTVDYETLYPSADETEITDTEGIES